MVLEQPGHCFYRLHDLHGMLPVPGETLNAEPEGLTGKAMLIKSMSESTCASHAPVEGYTELADSPGYQYFETEVVSR